MNHHYPDNYHGGGYVRGAAGMQGMGYGHGGYDNPSAMQARMGHPRSSYPMPQYGDGGQMHPMMQHQQQGGAMYSHGGYMGQMGGNQYPNMGSYPGYNMQGMNHAGMNTPAAAAMPMGSRGHMMGNYYNHPVNPQHAGQQHTPIPMTNQTPSSGYSQSPDGSNPSMPHGQSQMIGVPPVNSQSPSQVAHHPSTMQRNHGSVATSTPSHGMPATQANSNSGFQSQVSSPQNSMMMPGSHAQARPVAGSMSGGSTHPVPQHPMRHPTTQQSPQEVADNILQIASSYPTNQTVQVPLKGRHAPYHIPRSPHYSASSSETGHSSPAVSHFQQPSPASQPSPTPSTSSVKSPTPALAPIPNPIPSPGISGIRSPSGHCLSPCGPQRSPGHMTSSYSGHCQPSPQHYSPNGRGTPQHLSAFAHSPPPPSSSSRNVSSYPASNDQAAFSQSDNQMMHVNYSNAQQPSSPQSSSLTTSSHSSMSNVQFNQQCGGNNPLMSLQKLVMLPETQVVDPKSVVNDACLSSHQNESNANSKNCEDPAERFVESSGLSVGCSGQSSSLGSQLGSYSHQNHESLATSLSSNEIAHAFADDMHDAKELFSDDNEINCLTATIQSEDRGNFSEKNDNMSSDHFSNILLTMPSEISETEKKDMSTISAQFESTTPLPNSESANHVNLLEQASSDPAGLALNDNQVDMSGKETLDNDNMTKETKVKDFTDSVVSEESHQTDLETLNFLEHVPRNQEVQEPESKALQADLETLNFLGPVPGDQEIQEPESKSLQEDLETLNLPEPVAGNQENPEPDSKSLQADLETLNLPTPVPENPEPESKSLQADLETLNLLVPVPGNREMSGEKLTEESENSHVFTDLKKEDPPSDLKQVSPESKSPGVLSEVQVVVNGNDVSNIVEEDADKKSSRPRLRNGITSLVRSKLGMAKKASQFLRLTTPCSIAVGADEREVCEQFAFRRNGYCHALRASRLLYSGRSRQDSTGHGDSDESVENISDCSFHELGNPQDGCKKKNIAKKSDSKQSNAAEAQTDSKDEVIGKGGRNSGSVSSVQVASNVHESKDLSDEDGEPCYYEGVDSSDFVMNANSSDDSFSSSQEGKRKEQASITAVEDVQENSVASNPAEPSKKKSDEFEKQLIEMGQEDTDAVSSPPAKRTRRSPGQKLDGTTNKKSCLKNSEMSDTVTNGTNGLKDIHSERISKDLQLSTKPDENSLESENGKIPKTRTSKRKPVLGKLPTNVESKLPEAVVKLEKTEYVESSAYHKIDVIDLTCSSPKEEISTDPDPGSTGKFQKSSDGAVGVERELHEEGDEVVPEVKVEAQDFVSQDNAEASSSTSSRLPNKKRPAKRKQKKPDPCVQKGRDEELKDSFKSMKFSRTLDMMKSQRKKEQNFVGPFIRVRGDRTMPRSVSVFNQSAQNLAACSSKQSQKSSSKQSFSSSATIHMVSNLPSDKTALVCSTKTVSHQTWTCAFCNHQSSFHSLGDLFGPYYKEEDLPTVERLASEEAKKIKDSPVTSSDKKGSSKKRKSLVKKETGPQEVWIHEACALWAPGVYLIGNKLYGMDEAMKDTSECICLACKEKGAMIGCLHKGCAMKYHITCAMDKGCCLDEENLSLLCPKHKDKKMRVSSASTSLVS